MTDTKKDNHDDYEMEEQTPTGCGPLADYPVLSVMGFALVGVGVGVGLSFWEPDDMTRKEDTLKWLGLLGDLFIRALKAIVLPLVFVNVIISVVDMMKVGKASSIGWKTIGFYMLTTIGASLFGILSTLMFKGLYSTENFSAPGPAYVSLGCNEDGAMVAERDDGVLVCTANYTSMMDTDFEITDISGSFQRASSGARNDISLSDTIYQGVFLKLVTDNITRSFTTANFAAVVVFSIVFGVALSKVLDRNERHGKHHSNVIAFLEEIDGCLITMINWVIMTTPFAVMSLIINAVGGQEDLKEAFENVGYLVVATMVAMAMHICFVYIGVFALYTKSNPFEYISNLLPAQTMAFACASSAATIPMTLRSVISTGRVPESIAKFVVPLGATVNMDGGAIYFPCACCWLAVLNGIDLDASHYILLVIISTIGSVGTAPVPSASLVLIITAYNTVFNTTGTPDGFSYILAIDWFMDRLRTTTNVTGDGIVSGLVAMGEDSITHVSSEDAPEEKESAP